jgi:hypothetical protein
LFFTKALSPLLLLADGKEIKLCASLNLESNDKFKKLLHRVLLGMYENYVGAP